MEGASSVAVPAAPGSPASASRPLWAQGETPPPVYRATTAPSFVRQYELRRGGLRGLGEMRWRNEVGRYTLTLEGRVAGINLLTQTSRGLIDANGLAPQRFVDKRVRRPETAAEFRPDRKVVTFSASPAVFEWRAGVQDRLSWMLQLPSVLAATDRARLVEGTRFSMAVVAARGEADVWTFRLVGWETLRHAQADVKVVHLIREPRHAGDTQVDVWLEEARHFLPLRARLESSDDGTLELLLASQVGP